MKSLKHYKTTRIKRQILLNGITFYNELNLFNIWEDGWVCVCGVGEVDTLVFVTWCGVWDPKQNCTKCFCLWPKLVVNRSFCEPRHYWISNINTWKQLIWKRCQVQISDKKSGSKNHAMSKLSVSISVVKSSQKWTGVRQTTYKTSRSGLPVDWSVLLSLREMGSSLDRIFRALKYYYFII